MSSPKTKLPPSNLQLVSDKEVAISLERLIDSVVMEVTAHRSALQLQQMMSKSYAHQPANCPWEEKLKQGIHLSFL